MKRKKEGIKKGHRVLSKKHKAKSKKPSERMIKANN
jgi:hypothetical protein